MVKMEARGWTVFVGIVIVTAGPWMLDAAVATQEATSIAYLGVGEQVLEPPGPDPATNTGGAVAVDGTAAAVGADGEVHIYELAPDPAGLLVGPLAEPPTWTLVQRLTPPPEAFWGYRFGASLALDGDVLAVGSPAEAPNHPEAKHQGQAYVFERAPATGQWELAATLTGEPRAWALMGSAIDVDGDTVVVGAQWDNQAGSHAGAAYVFQRTAQGTWEEQIKLLPSQPNGWFGQRGSVAVSGDTIAVGARNQAPSGAVYTFTRAQDDGWSQEAKVRGDHQFGHSVALEGDTMVVGEPTRTPQGQNWGGAYILVREAGTWTEQALLTASDGGPLQRFGDAVDIEAGIVAVGDPRAPATVEEAGAVYLFARHLVDPTGEAPELLAWHQQAKLSHADGGTGDLLGHSVAVDASLLGGHVLAGAPGGPGQPGYAVAATGIGVAAVPNIPAG